MPYSISIGIDISKSKFDFCVLSLCNKVLSSGSFSNDPSGINSFIKYLKQFDLSSSIIVIESTGDYHLLTSITLLNSGLNVSVINPLITKKYIKASIRKLKSDKSDSKLLALIGFKEDNLPSFSFSINSITKTKLCSLISTLEKHLSSIKLAKKNFLITANELTIDTSPLIGLQEAIDALENSINQLNIFLSSLISSTNIVDDLGSVKGISKNSASKVIALIEDKHFTNRSKIIAYSGLDVSVKQSGKFVGKTRLTKRGNPNLRKYLYQMSWGVSMHNVFFKQIYSYYKSKGRKHTECLNIIARKLLKIIYKLMLSNTSFNQDMLKFVV